MKGAHLRRHFSLSDYCLMALAACLFIIGAWHMAVDANPDGRVSSLTVKNTTTTTALINSSAIEPETATTVEPTTTTTAPSAPRKAPRVSKNAVASVALPSSTTTTTESPKTPLEVAQSQVGKTGSYADDGFWCAKFVSWTAEQAKIDNWQSSDSPARLYQLAKDEGRLISEPHPGVMVFIDLTGQNFANQYISHAGIVECKRRRARDHSGQREPGSVRRDTYDLQDRRRVRDRIRRVRGPIMKQSVWEWLAGCETCGKRHELRDQPGGFVTWADPADGHPYRHRLSPDTVDRLRTDYEKGK